MNVSLAYLVCFIEVIGVKFYLLFKKIKQKKNKRKFDKRSIGNLFTFTE